MLEAAVDYCAQQLLLEHEVAKVASVDAHIVTPGSEKLGEVIGSGREEKRGKVEIINEKYCWFVGNGEIDGRAVAGGLRGRARRSTELFHTGLVAGLDQSACLDPTKTLQRA